MILELFKNIAECDETRLLIVLEKFLRKSGYKKIWSDSSNYVCAEGELPICLIAHLDTVFRQPPAMFYYDEEQSVLWSPDGMGADDRAGVYAIVSLVNRGFRPSIIFTTGEETGCIGADALIKKYRKCIFKKNTPKALIQLDRRGRDHCVFYNCDNKEFQEYIEHFGFQTKHGSFTDISVIAPAWGIAAVNLSIGYENEHTIAEILHTNWLDETLDKVTKILEQAYDMDFYKYVAAPVSALYGWNRYFDDPLSCLICGQPLGIDKVQKIDEYGTFCVCPQCDKDYFTV